MGSPRVRCTACCSQSVPAPRGGSARPCGQDAPQRNVYGQVCKTRVKPSYACRRSALSLMRCPLRWVPRASGAAAGVGSLGAGEA